MYYTSTFFYRYIYHTLYIVCLSAPVKELGGGHGEVPSGHLCVASTWPWRHGEIMVIYERYGERDSEDMKIWRYDEDKMKIWLLYGDYAFEICIISKQRFWCKNLRRSSNTVQTLESNVECHRVMFWESGSANTPIWRHNRHAENMSGKGGTAVHGLWNSIWHVLKVFPGRKSFPSRTEQDQDRWATSWWRKCSFGSSLSCSPWVEQYLLSDFGAFHNHDPINSHPF